MIRVSCLNGRIQLIRPNGSFLRDIDVNAVRLALPKAQRTIAKVEAALKTQLGQIEAGIGQWYAIKVWSLSPLSWVVKVFIYPPIETPGQEWWRELEETGG